MACNRPFLNYSIELSKRGFPVLPVVRNESVVEIKLREAGISSIAVINNRFGFYDPFAIRQIGDALDEFFHFPPPHIVQSFGSRATLFASKLKSQVRRWPLIASLPNSINHKYYKGCRYTGTFDESVVFECSCVVSVFDYAFIVHDVQNVSCEFSCNSGVCLIGVLDEEIAITSTNE